MTEKGKYASATESRRFVWEQIVWPLILELNDLSYTLKQYQKKRDEVCAKFNIKPSKTAGGFVSLLQKGIIFRENELYSIHSRLIAYLRLKAECDYATAVRESSTK